ncbi:hypothetical protein [Rhodospira trueperi]|nr:hypothetical protein [Rhodospira trueperi]
MLDINDAITAVSIEDEDEWAAAFNQLKHELFGWGQPLDGVVKSSNVPQKTTAGASLSREERFERIKGKINAINHNKPEIRNSFIKFYKINVNEYSTESRYNQDIIDKILKLDIYHCLSILTNAIDSFEGLSKKEEVRAVKRIASYLIPFVCVQSFNVMKVKDADHAAMAWETLDGRSDVILLRVGIGTFAEIIVAGLNRSYAEFASGLDDPTEFPAGKYALCAQSPEDGFESTGDLLRECLWNKFVSTRPPNTLSNAEKDSVINGRLNYLLRERGVRYYIFLEELSDKCSTQAEILNEMRYYHEIYPAIVYVEIDPDLYYFHLEMLERMWMFFATDDA